MNDTVKVSVTNILLPTYLPAAPDKNPMFLEKRVYQGSGGKVYPLPFTDRIAEKPVDREWRAVWIENEYLRVLVLPELGGRIHAMLDKTNGYDLIYNQPVIKPALVGLAGPWASGGIEFNWPQHHRPAPPVGRPRARCRLAAEPRCHRAAEPQRHQRRADRRPEPLR